MRLERSRECSRKYTHEVHEENDKEWKVVNVTKRKKTLLSPHSVYIRTRQTILLFQVNSDW